jgi:hypothetical protein
MSLDTHRKAKPRSEPRLTRAKAGSATGSYHNGLRSLREPKVNELCQLLAIDAQGDQSRQINRPSISGEQTLGETPGKPG